LKNFLSFSKKCALFNFTQLQNGVDSATWHPSDSTVSSTGDQKLEDHHISSETAGASIPTGDNEEILNRINALLENTLNQQQHQAPPSKLTFSNDVTQG